MDSPSEHREIILERPAKTTKVSLSDLKFVIKERVVDETTKSISREVLNQDVITAENGDTLMYVINYKNNLGFDIISATRNYYPLVFKSEKGNFSKEDISGAFAFALSEKKDIIHNQIISPDSSILDLAYFQWKKYNEKYSLDITKTTDGDELYEEYTYLWNAEGYNVMTLRDYYDSWDYNAQFYKDHFIEVAQQYANNDYDYLDYSFVISKEIFENNSAGPMLLEYWDQHAPFNNKMPKYNGGNGSDTGRYAAGCVNIALGAIMNYYEYPTYFLWEKIGKDTLLFDADITADFIIDLNDKTKSTFNNNTGTNYSTIENALSAFNYYGYRNAVIDEGFDHNKVITNLDLNKPIYISAYDSVDEIGHAWVIDGYNERKSREVVELKIINQPNYSGEPLDYYTANSYTVYYDPYRVYVNEYFHNNINEKTMSTVDNLEFKGGYKTILNIEPNY
ncbi:MAG: C10 family peptidase [Rikenellaceae bacterium]